ncbi:hypothetical protein D9M70_495330 [compost metagenome]
MRPTQHVDEHHIVRVFVDGLGAGGQSPLGIELQEIDPEEARHRLRLACQQIAIARGLGVLAGRRDVETLLRLERRDLLLGFGFILAVRIALNEARQRRRIGRLYQGFPGNLVRRHARRLLGLSQKLQLLFGKHLIDRVRSMLGQEGG